jgi:hypothetical protein
MRARTRYIDKWTHVLRTHVSMRRQNAYSRRVGMVFTVQHSGGEVENPILSVASHTSAHTQSKTPLSLSLTANLRSRNPPMGHLEKPPPNPRIAPTSHPEPAPPPPPTTSSARLPGTPWRAAQVIGPSLLPALPRYFPPKSSCRSRFPSVGFCCGEVKCWGFVEMRLPFPIPFRPCGGFVSSFCLCWFASEGQ